MYGRGTVASESWATTGVSFTECEHPLDAEVNEYGNALWPQSDDYMIEQTFNEYKDLQPFHIYYLTISGHRSLWIF